MTLEELWQLFPITLVPHDDRWNGWAIDEIRLLKSLLTDNFPIVNHIGSTSIPGIYAKPIIDILVEVSTDKKYDAIKNILETAGYICMYEDERRMSFNKGYTPMGYAGKVYHVHVHRQGDNDEILFRDYLLAHPLKAKEYESLKLSLLPKYRNDRDGYTEAKSDFINHILFSALALSTTSPLPDTH